MIGIFDSGVGGLSVWREVRRCLPDVPLIYLADQAHVPYGPRSSQEITQFAERCVRELIARGCHVIVIACNTATAAALPYLRKTFPHIPFVGMEPAVKPAVALTQTGVIGVLATHTTAKSERLADLVHRFAQHVRVIEQACPIWVELVERGEFDHPHAFAQVADDLQPLLLARVDTLVLGCTHFPFLLTCIQQAIQRYSLDSRIHMHVIDPAPAVAQQCRRLWRMHAADHISKAGHKLMLLTTGDAQRFAQLTYRLLATADVAHNDLCIESVTV